MRISSLKAFRPIAFKLEYVMDKISQQMTGTGVGLLWPLAIPFRRGEICKDKLFQVWRKQIHVARLHLILFFTRVSLYQMFPLSPGTEHVYRYIKKYCEVVGRLLIYFLVEVYLIIIHMRRLFDVFLNQSIYFANDTDVIKKYNSWSRLSNYHTLSLGQVMRSHYCVSLWATRK